MPSQEVINKLKELQLKEAILDSALSRNQNQQNILLDKCDHKHPDGLLRCWCPFCGERLITS